MSECKHGTIKGLCSVCDRKQPTVTISRECAWTREDSEYGCYNTECGQTFELNDGDLDSNGFKFCYSCGGKIKEKAMEVRVSEPTGKLKFAYSTIMAHEATIAEQGAEIDELVSGLGALMASLGGGQKLCGHEFNCVCAAGEAKTLLAKHKAM